MQFLFVMTLTIDGAKDAPLVVVLDGCPSFSRLIDCIKASEKSVDTVQIAKRFSGTGLTDNTLAQTMVLLTRALAAGEWPSVEYRLDDDSLLVFQLCALHHAKLIPASLAKLRRPNKS